VRLSPYFRVPALRFSEEAGVLANRNTVLFSLVEAKVHFGQVDVTQQVVQFGKIMPYKYTILVRKQTFAGSWITNYHSAETLSNLSDYSIGTPQYSPHVSSELETDIIMLGPNSEVG
jgi:hypothetical protein